MLFNAARRINNMLYKFDVHLELHFYPAQELSEHCNVSFPVFNEKDYEQST